MILAMITKFTDFLRGVYRRRYYVLQRLLPAKLPEFNLAYLPDGLAIRKLGETGVSLVENFCTAEEAENIRKLAEPHLAPARIFRDGKAMDHSRRQCHTATIFGAGRSNPELLPIACRAAALTGLPYTHMEGVVVTRYSEGGYYREHLDYGDYLAVNRLYTVLVYLNDLAPEQGGTTVFPDLNIEVAPRLGRAVCWTNTNPDGTGHEETRHAAMPVKAGGEKWVIQFWFHSYKMFSDIKTKPPQAVPGKPIDTDAEMPSGASFFMKARKQEDFFE